jgi:flagellar hook-associated protein 2
MASGLNLSGLASGIDTGTIIDQLMALERQPQTRMKLQLSQSDARKQALSDVVTRLKNLQTAARDLKSVGTWADTQSVDVSDITKASVTRTGVAGTGSYAITASALARGAQRWYTYSQPGSNSTINFGGGVTATIPAGSDIDAAVTAINADTDSPVYAAAVTDSATGTEYLVFSSRQTGLTAGAFTASGSTITEDTTRRIASRDLTYTVNGVTKTNANNVVTDGIPGVSLTFKTIITAANNVSVTVGAAAPDNTAITAKVKAFVDQYNSTIDFIRSKLDEKKVVKPETTADALKGMLNGDTMLEGVMRQMRTGLTAQYAAGNPTALDELSEIGISTGATVGSGALNKDAIAGKLVFDSAKFAKALTDDPVSVRKLLGGDTSVSGFAQAFDTLLTPTLQAGGVMDQRISNEDSNHKRISDSIARMDTQLAKKQDILKRQFAAMESALQASQAQGQWLSGQLAGLSNNG